MSGQFTENQRAFIDLWGQLPFRSQAQTAKLAGVTPRTVSEWRHDPAFIAACDASRAAGAAELTKAERDELLKALPKARRTLIANLQSDSRIVRQQAAVFIWEMFEGKTPDEVRVAGEMRHEHQVSLDGLSDAELDTLESIALRLAGHSGSESEAPAP